MSARQTLIAVADALPEERVEELLDYARFLLTRADALQWQQVARAQFARAYGDDEPEYTLQDIMEPT